MGLGTPEGDSVTKSPEGGVRVPKRDLISATLVLLHNGQLKIADALPLKNTLVKELLNFRMKITIPRPTTSTKPGAKATMTTWCSPWLWRAGPARGT
ncbi:MAG: hypothetical protein M3N09_02230 [Actinomycetota bacterium]|nr:hypothetical protein [Actinomycetota bacterium]